MSYAVIIPAAGSGKRMGAGKNKVLLEINNVPIIIKTIQAFIADTNCSKIVVVIQPNDEQILRSLVVKFHLSSQVEFIYGGLERQDSVYNGLKSIVDEPYVFVHDGARPYVSRALLNELYEAVQIHKAVIPAVKVKDTIKRGIHNVVKETLVRDELFSVQTPQAFDKNVLQDAFLYASKNQIVGTDDASLVEAMGHPVHISEGDYRNIKITTPEDLDHFSTGEIEKKRLVDVFKIGQGFDVHELVEGRPLIIGGITIPYEKGLIGHSDADVLLHTVTDALLGAIGEGDIGKHFPDTSADFKDADSKVLLREIVKLVHAKGYVVGNIDCTIIAQKPKMLPFIPQMKEVMASLLEIEVDCVNVKATTTEQLGFTGRGEGIAAQAVALVLKK